jgi:putative ABC transport system ATP-binding protein
MKDKNKKVFNSKKSIVVEGIDIVKKYRNNDLIVDVLKKVNITIREGEIVSIIGPSGCGKTTLLNCLSGIDDIDNGEIYFLEKDIESMTDNQKTNIRAKDMGFIFQSFNLIPVLSAVENVELPMLLVGGNAKESRKRAIELLEDLGLGHRLNNKPNQLSGGEKQRVAIARALINNPKVVWADEPTGNLDTKNSEETLKLITNLNKEKGITFVIVTHDLNIASKADRIIRMDSGEIKN